MEEKNNISTESLHQLLISINPSSGQPPSDGLRKVQRILNLLMEDFEKSHEYLEQLERYASAPIEFGTLQRLEMHLIKKLQTVTDRGIENYQHAIDRLGEVYAQSVELETGISRRVNSRFNFWRHTLSAEKIGEGGPSQEVSTFAEFLKPILEKQSNYAYFLAPCGGTHLLLCRYISPKAPSENFELQFSTYVSPPSGSAQFLKRAWNKLFGAPNTILFHLFRHSLPRPSMGTFKKRVSIAVPPYHPHHHDTPGQLPQIIYDFLNIYGIDGRSHVHLLKGNEQFAIFTTLRPIQTDGRSALFSDADIRASGDAAKAIDRLMIE